jgi:hypothetical protein
MIPKLALASVVEVAEFFSLDIFEVKPVGL